MGSDDQGAFRWDHDLSAGALRVAGAEGDPLRVLAGPGTGKTFALIRRVARLLQDDGYAPERIFVCTFARTAAGDLQSELQELVVPGAADVYAATLHSFCFRVLRRRRVLELTGRVPRTLLRYEIRFLEEDLQQGNDFGSLTETRDRLSAFNAAWARRQTDDPGWATDPVDRAFERALHRWLGFHRCMHIGEVVPQTLDYLRANPMAAEHDEFDVLVVDEYQDLNRAEQELLDCLAESARLTIAGDEDQSIYSFKYAWPDGISQFAETHPGTHDERLESCRRCPQLVVRLARRLIQENETRADRGFEPRAENPEGQVRVVQWGTQEEEAEGLAEFVLARIEAEEVDPGEVLVLTSSRQIGYDIRDAISLAGAVAHSFFQEQDLSGSPKNLDQSGAQQAFALLTLLADPSDRVALRTWCGFGGSTLYSGGWRRVIAHANEHALPARDVLELLAEGSLSLPYTEPLVGRFYELRDAETGLAGSRGEELLQELFPQDQEWADPFWAYAESIEENDYGPQRLHGELASAIVQPELPRDVDYIRVMSLHKSKGLSADLVVVAGCSEGLIPRHGGAHLSEEEIRQHLEEQRRLFYVAITRTRRSLVISSFAGIEYGRGRRMGLQIRQYGRTVASRFLRELGPELPAALRGEEFARG